MRVYLLSGNLLPITSAQDVLTSIALCDLSTFIVRNDTFLLSVDSISSAN